MRNHGLVNLMWGRPLDVSRLGLAILLSAVLQPPPHAAAQVLVELSDVACPECKVVLRPVVTLGEASGKGMLELSYQKVTRDSRGRYYVSGIGPPYFWVFDASGKLLKRVGRSGEGPGEFSIISRIAIDRSDSVFVFDSRQGRISVLSPDLEFIRTARFGLSAGGRGAEFLGSRLVINAGIHTPDRVGFPIHVLGRDGEILRSFGAVAGGVYRPDLSMIIDLREIGVGTSQTLWAARINQYVIERWDLSGQLLQTFRRPVHWFEPWWEPGGGATEPPDPTLIAIEQEGDTLWVLISIAGAEWKSAVEPAGRLYTVTDRDAYRDVMVEAIDLSTGRIIASTRLAHNLSDFLGHGLVARNDTDRAGNPVIVIERLQISRP